MAETITVARRTVQQALWATKCRCGGEKKPRVPFCASCHAHLERATREGLNKPLGKGLEQAYTAALKQLERIFG